MKKFLLLCSVFLICCDNQADLDIEFLKDNGYKEVTCQTIESYQTDESSFIEINRKFDQNKDFILARCFDKDSCLLSLNFSSRKIVCQRYIISRENQDKRDYTHNDYREFVDHRVLYLSVDYRK
jgi:hypothetical protein